jgi:cysteine synthase
VRLRAPAGDDAAEVWIKLEGGNPTGSMKDRMARSMVEGALARGDLQPGGTVVEFTGGSTGANVTAALDLARRLRPGRRVVTVAPDSGLKYLQGDLYA